MILQALTSDMNQHVNWLKIRESCDSVSLSGMPTWARSHNSDRHSSILYLAELTSNKITCTITQYVTIVQ